MNIDRFEFKAALETWHSSKKGKLREWAKEFCEDYKLTLWRAAQKGVPVGKLLSVVEVIRKLKQREEDNRPLAAELRRTLIEGGKRLRPQLRKLNSYLRNNSPVLTYIGFPLDHYLEKAERTLAALPSKSRGQPRKDISTQRFILLGEFFKTHTGTPDWDLVAEICDAFEEEALGDTGKRVRRLTPAERTRSGALADAIRIPPISRIPTKERKAWLALQAEQIERDMLDHEAMAFREGRIKKKKVLKKRPKND